MRRFVPFIIFAVVFMAPVLVLGQDHLCPPVDVNLSVADQAQTWWMVLLDFLLQLVTPIAIAVLTTLAGIAVRKWGNKLDTDKQEALIRLTDSLITSGISFAEEQGRKAFRTDNVKTESAQKLSLATEFISRQLSSSGLPGIEEDELVKLIEARLAQERTKPDGVIPNDDAPVVAEKA
jgi:hypothetical protein